MSDFKKMIAEDNEKSLSERVEDFRKGLNEQFEKSIKAWYGVDVEEYTALQGNTAGHLIINRINCNFVANQRILLAERVREFEEEELRKEQIKQVSMQTELLRRLLDRSEVEE